MARSSAQNREPNRQAAWSNMLLPCAFLFVLLGYVWMPDNEYVGYMLMLTGLVVGVGSMANSIRNEKK